MNNYGHGCTATAQEEPRVTLLTVLSFVYAPVMHFLPGSHLATLLVSTRDESTKLQSDQHSLRIAVVIAVLVVAIFFTIVVVFLVFFLIWLLSSENTGPARAIRVARVGN